MTVTVTKKMSQRAASASVTATGSETRSRYPRVLDMAVDGASGLAGGVCSVSVGHPLDTAKVMMQTQAAHPSGAGAGGGGGGTVVPRPGLVASLREVLHSRGIVHGWYAGASAALAATASENTILFLSYGQISELVDAAMSLAVDRDALPPSTLALVSGGASGGAAALVTSLALCPIELIKVRVQTGRSAGVLACASEVFRAHGLRGFYAALGATVLREVPGNVAFFGMYASCSSALQSPAAHALPLPGDAKILLAGGLAGQAFWAVSLPADNIKTRQQAFGKKSAPSVQETARRIWAEQGVRGFYRGLAPCMLRAFPSNAALFWGFETTKATLSQRL